MTVTNELEKYIFNCLKKFNPALRNYKEDALQEIRYAILVSSEEKESLRLSGRLCSKMMRQYGFVSSQARERFEEYCLSAQYTEENDSDIIDRIDRIYGMNYSEDDVCRRFNIKSNKEINSLPVADFTVGAMDRVIKHNKIKEL